MIDASFIESPKQRNSRKENELIKEGHTPKGWSDQKIRMHAGQRKTTPHFSVTRIMYQWTCVVN